VSSDCDNDSEDEGQQDDDGEAATKAREKAKNQAKAGKKSNEQQRPIDVVSSTLKGGFEMIEKVFSSRHQHMEPDRSNHQLLDAVQTLSASITRTQQEQREIAETNRQANHILVETVQNLHKSSQQTTELLARLLEKLN
jgi:hypothetical protein